MEADESQLTVFAELRMQPSMQLVVAVAPDFCTPLITMQR